MDLLESPSTSTSSEDQMQMKEQHLKDLWSSLLDNNTARVCSRYLKNDDCTIKVLLRVIYQQFKEILGSESHVDQVAATTPDKNSPRVKKQLFVDSPELELLRERNAYLESKLAEIADLLDNYNVLEARKLARDALSQSRTSKASPYFSKAVLSFTSTDVANPKTVLAAPTPEKATQFIIKTENDVSYETERRVIPETVPIDYDLDATFIPPSNDEEQSPMKTLCNHTKSPIIKGKRKASSNDNVSPVTVKNIPLKRGKSDEFLTYCSPSLMERDALDYEDLTTTPKKSTRGSTNSPRSPAGKASPFKSPLPMHSPRSLKPELETSGKKHWKQMTLFETSCQGKLALDSKPEIRKEPEKAEKKPVFLTRPKSHDWKVRRKKTPEDWSCAECRRLFYESGIDTRKLQVAMNFCLEHRNRFSYYLQTPPGFWDPDIPQGPRRAKDCEPQDDDDDFK